MTRFWIFCKKLFKFCPLNYLVFSGVFVCVFPAGAVAQVENAHSASIVTDISTESETDASGSDQNLDSSLVSRLKGSVVEDYGFHDQFDAQVWFTSMEPRLKKYMDDPDERYELLNLVHREAKKVGLEPALVMAVITVESRFDRYAVSRAGAQGLMQVMSFWKNEIGRDQDNLINTQTNLRYGTTILKHYMDRSNQNWTEALARYNGSYPKRWYAERVFDALEIWR